MPICANVIRRNRSCVVGDVDQPKDQFIGLRSKKFEKNFPCLSCRLRDREYKKRYYAGERVGQGLKVHTADIETYHHTANDFESEKHFRLWQWWLNEVINGR